MAPKKIKAALYDARLRSKAKRNDMIKQKIVHWEKYLKTRKQNISARTLKYFVTLFPFKKYICFVINYFARNQ